MTDDSKAQIFTRIPRWTAPSGGGQGVGVYRALLPVEPTAALERAAADLGTTLPALLLVAHARVLAAVVSERDLLIGYRAAGPGAVETPLRLRVSRSSWADLVAEVTAAAAGVHQAQKRPETLLDLSGLAAPAAGAHDALPQGVVLRIAWDRDGDALALRIGYDRSVLDESYAARLADYHLTALRQLVASPAEPHDRQSLLSAGEIETQLYGLAGPRAELPDKTFVDLFQERVRTAPDAIAAEHGTRRWTYAELAERADRIAGALLAAGLRTEDVVAVVMDRTLDWIAAALGVFAAGGVYLPVRPDFPADRVAAQFDRSNCVFALTEPGSEELTANASAGLAEPPVTLSVPAIHAAGGPAEPPAVTVTPGQAAYIYFTSGSTGAPKGAVCEHLGMLNHLFMKIEDMGMPEGPGEVVAQTASQCFDISLWQFAAPLVTGGTVRIVENEVQLDVDRFMDELVDARVTVAQIVPTYLEMLLARLEQQSRDLGVLRIVSVTGEALKYDLVKRWFAIFPGIKLVNGFGATEVSDDTTHEVLDGVPERDFISVGRSRHNVNTYILDEDLELIPLGSTGEIAFSGICVGRGYINDEERTRAVFVPDPFRKDTRMYRTGDYGRWLPEGRIEFLGRRDEQVKVRGYRIEIGEIENKLLAMDGIREAAVVIDGATGEQRKLVAFLGGTDPQLAERARQHLAMLVPEYMMPTYFHQLDRLPLTENGKIDKKALIRLAGTLGHAGAAYVAPTTPAERNLAMLWAEVLGVPLERIGRADNFFDLGGTSLAAVRLLVRLDRALSLKDLAAHPVLGDLAAVLDERERGGERAAQAALLQPLSSVRAPRATLICFPYASGNALNFRSFAAELERDGIAVLGVELPGHDFANDAEPLLDVPAIALKVRDEIAERVSTPVLLWGHCVGAAAALETARLLEEAGTPAARVFIAGLLLDDEQVLRAESAEVTTADNQSLLAFLRTDNAYVEFDALKPERADVVARAYRHDVLTANAHLLAIHQNPCRYWIDGPIELVLARDDASTARFGQGYGDWKAICDQVTVREVDQGGHYFVSTRPAEAAKLVLAAWLSSEQAE
ncbi:amino acid adenylation domain-containing protein [Streptomyces sp. NPDC056638]|uniref:non-ribosomal peptide synthetase n=1 Tax=Streptomyces sp. NPDC056638 TaxID=3345887 RepID=UPI00369B2964